MKHFRLVSTVACMVAMMFQTAVLAAGANADDSSSNSQPVAVVACWPLASNAVNTVGENDYGTLVGDASFQNASLVLNGGYVDFGAGEDLNTGDSITFFLWLKPGSESRFMRVLGRFRIQDNNRAYCIFLDPDNRIWVFLSDDGSATPDHASVQTTSESVVAPGEWQSLAITWVSKQGGDGLRIYVDGESVPTLSAQSPDIQSIYNGTANLTLGAYDIDSEHPEIVSNSFIGAISDVLFFRGALPALDVQGIHDLGRGNAGKWIEPANTELMLAQLSSATATNPESPSTTDSALKNAGNTNAQVLGHAIYADVNAGDDSFDGKSASVTDRATGKGPLKKIKTALGKARPGDTVYVAEGVYKEGTIGAPDGVTVIPQGKVSLVD